jgi:outer membrane protein assembly factor BamB
MYGLSFSPDGHLLFGTSNFPSPTVDILDFKERKLVRRFALPKGFAILGAWVSDDYYVYAYRKPTGELWRVKADGSELATPVKINLPAVTPECELHDQGILAAGGRLWLFELFGGKGDRRVGCRKDIPGGVFLVNPQTGKQIAHIAPELHFAQLISTEDGAELYGIDLASAGWTSVALVRLNATTGQVLVKQNLSSDVWFIHLANIPDELLPRGQVEANASK